MPASPLGVWVEYDRGDRGIEPVRPETIVRPHRNKMTALEAAVENQNGAIEIPFGSTLAEALATKAAAPKARASRVTEAAADAPGRIA